MQDHELSVASNSTILLILVSSVYKYAELREGSQGMSEVGCHGYTLFTVLFSYGDVLKS